MLIKRVSKNVFNFRLFLQLVAMAVTVVTAAAQVEPGVKVGTEGMEKKK